MIGAPLHAGYHGINIDDVADVDILPGWRTDDGGHIVGLRIRLAPGWKTYWRAPGDAGIPPRFNWRRSKNLAGVRYHWPVPDIFHQNGMRSVGYEGEVVLPIELTPKSAGKAIALRARIEIGICEDVCVPVTFRLSTDVSGAGAPDARIQSALNARADTAAEAGMRKVSCRVDPIADGLRLTAEIDMPQISRNEVAVFELPDARIWVSEASTQRDGRTLRATADLVPPNSKPFALDRSSVRITLIGSGRAVDIRGCAG